MKNARIESEDINSNAQPQDFSLLIWIILLLAAAVTGGWFAWRQPVPSPSVSGRDIGTINFSITDAAGDRGHSMKNLVSRLLPPSR